MTTGFDRLIQRIPGSMPFKAFVAGMTLCTVMAYPVFGPKSAEKKTQQGHDYISQERPEAV